MFMNEDLKLSVFANLQSYNSKPVGIDEIVRMVRHDIIVKNKTLGYRAMAKTISEAEAKKNIKEKIVEAFSVAVLFNGTGKRAEHVLGFTGLAMVDFDKIDNGLLTIDDCHADGSIPKSSPPKIGGVPERGGSMTTALEQVKRLIIADPHTLLCYTTISNKGLRVIYRYQREDTTEQTRDSQSSKLDTSQVCQTDDFKSPVVNVQLDGVPWRAAFQCGNEFYRQLTGCEYDKACSDYVRLSGFAHDPEAYYNPNAEPFIITDEMILKANFSEDTEPGKPRKVYETGSQSTTAKEVWPQVQKMLAKRGMEYVPQHRHDYILHACYLFNRFGVPEEDLREWASGEWNDKDEDERECIITHCYKKGMNDFGTWRMSREPRKKRHENSMITIAEIRQWLSDHVQLCYNVVTDQTMLKTIDNSRLTIDNYKWQVVDDRILASLRSQMAIDTDKRVLKNDVYDVIKSDFAPLVHPIRDYINGLPKWDGKDRVAELTSHIRAEAVVPGQTEEEAQQTLNWAFHKWLSAMVGTWMDDHVTNHQVFTLIGRQGIYKTTFFRYLLPPELRAYFWENAHNTFSTKDDHLALAENCLVDIEEVEATTQHELSELKSLITSDTIKERRPYARFRDAKHRLASLCATGNQQRFLTDETGNRRWLCFKVSHIDDPRTWQLDYQQLYAQLRDELRNGFHYWFDYEDEKRVELINQPFRVESDEEQLIRTRLRPPHEGESTKLMNSAMICQLLNGGHVGYPLSTRKVSVAMKRLGFESVHCMSGNFFRVFEIPYDQIQARLAADAYDSAHEAPPEPDKPMDLELPL